MTYLFCLLVSCLVLGFIGVAANPSPFFGAVGLVVAAGGGCGLLVMMGSSFVSLVLFLIYLGGMLVVFAYSVALAAEPFPESWLDYTVFIYLVGCGVFVFAGVVLLGDYVSAGGWGLMGVDGEGVFCVRSDVGGVVMLYSLGGGFLMLSGFCLVLALFVVLELTRGLARGGLRIV
uniref:NADH-ubiquinone oxidoreductase chain 6 n=1 Tax=Bavayia robusta TaxID=942151 RepID=A0A1W7HP63_9SAUR|nr:NADH dehydrogenase subunit 6 [Bavayia robusta]BAX39027.1 NADH dehydrogenase subunit 6 [Bavayia robusta]